MQLLGGAEEESSLQIVDDTAVPSHLVSKKIITKAPRVQRQADALALLDNDREEGEMSEAEDEEAGRAAQLKWKWGPFWFTHSSRTIMNGRKAGQQATQWEIHCPFHSDDAAAGKRQDCKRACGYGEVCLHTEDDCVATLKMWALLGRAAQTRTVGVHAHKHLEYNLQILKNSNLNCMLERELADQTPWIKDPDWKLVLPREIAENKYSSSSSDDVG